MKPLDRGSIRKILVIKLRAVGDVLLSTIVTKNLRLAFPEARIDYLTEPPSRDLLESNPFLDSTLVYDRTTMTGPGLIRMVRSGAYDLVIDLFGNPRTALVTRLSGARYRAGFSFRGRRYAYNIRVEPRGATVHNTQFNLDAIQALGVEIQDRNIYFQYSPKDDEFARAYFGRSGIGDRLRFGMCTGGGWYTKRWALDRFAELADTLIQRLDAAIILLWGPGQLTDVEHIRSRMKGSPFIPPGSTLLQLGALLKQCSIVISNDSGPMHIAAAVGTPVLGIYGPTNPVLQGPYGDKHAVVRREGLDCLGCNLVSCPIGHPCMNELSVETVLDGVMRLLKKNDLIP